MNLTFSIKITEVDSEFHRAHQHVLDKIGGAVNYPGLIGKEDKHWIQVESGWKEWINALPAGPINPKLANYPSQLWRVRPSSAWSYLWFPSKKDYTLFLLRWSGV